MTATETQPSRATRSVNLKVLGPILALVVLVIVGAALNGNFLSAANITNVLSRSAFIGIIAVGMTFVITVERAGPVGWVHGGLHRGADDPGDERDAAHDGAGVAAGFVGMLTAMVAGTLAGFVNGFLITTMRIEAFIVTLGTMGIYRSLVTWLADGGTLSLDFGMRSVIRPIYFDGILGISWPIIVFALVAIIGELVMRRAAFGRHAAAVGSNDQVARYSSVNVNRVRMLTYVFLGILVGVATIMYVPRLGSASPSTGCCGNWKPSRR